MRDIGSRSITGPQAVLCAAVRWWLSGFRLSKLVEAALGSASPADLWARDPSVLGASLPGVPWDRVNQHFWDSSFAVPAVRSMVEHAVRCWRPEGGSGRVAEARQFVASVIVREAGEMALSSPMMAELEEEILAARRSRRRPRALPRD